MAGYLENGLFHPINDKISETFQTFGARQTYHASTSISALGLLISINLRVTTLEEEPTVEIVRQGIIESEYDLTDLHIIDRSRLCSYWRHAGDAIRAISSWFIWRAMYTVVKCDLRQAPDRDDWPGWKHVGRHEEIGCLYWNYFHLVEMGTLSFHDEPDFSGTLDLEDEAGQRRRARFWEISAKSQLLLCPRPEADEQV